MTREITELRRRVRRADRLLHDAEFALLFGTGRRQASVASKISAYFVAVDDAFEKVEASKSWADIIGRGK